MKTYNYAKLTPAQAVALCKRDYLLGADIKSTVAQIGRLVAAKGDRALLDLTRKIDGVKLKTLLASPAEIAGASAQVSAPLKAAIKTAKANIEKFHKAQLPPKAAAITTSPGVKCWREFRAIESAGLYVPGGSAPLFSTVLMLAVPAKIAGCREIILCTPPGKGGKIAPEILYSAQLCGVSKIYKLGGAQAVFAMAYGTKTVPKADKIFGPGNQYVTEAKMQASSICAIDMPAGPSEALIIADRTTDAKSAAADILSQAEHGGDSQSVLVCADAAKTRQILAQVALQAKALPRRASVQKALAKSFAVNVKNIKEALAFSNLYAPEHLVLNFKDWARYTKLIANAGSVFCGPYTGEPLGDYASGTNHTLPTAGFARSFSGVNTQSFGKWITYQSANKAGLKTLGPKVALMARSEGLQAHANAVLIRMEK